jgi:hypothetical protein
VAVNVVRTGFHFHHYIPLWCASALKLSYWGTVLPGHMLKTQKHTVLEDNTEMNLKDTVWEDVDWICLDRDQCWDLVNTIINLHFP